MCFPTICDTVQLTLAECLRDIGLEDDAMRIAMSPEETGAFRYCRSLLGQEWAHIDMWEGVAENAVG